MAWDLKVAEMKTHYLTDKDIWQSTHAFYYHSKNTTTYKYGFMKALLENIATTNEHFEISFDNLFYTFTKIYWNLVIHHQLWQSNSKRQSSAVQKTIEEFAFTHAIPKQWSFDQLPNTQQFQLVQKVKTVGKKYVIGATYSDFNGEIYSFDLKKEYLQLHPQYYVFFQTHKRMLTNVTNYQLALFLEKFNVAELVNRLLTKVEFVTQRKSLKEFSQLLFQAGIEHCFYCHRKLTASTHVDHFIPWSYMQSDYLWNFVLACPSCNTRKNNKLATEHYLHTLIERNNTWVKEDIHTIAFETYTPEKLNSLYEYSKVNGFPYDWQPANISP